MKNNVVTMLAVGFARHTSEHLRTLLTEKLTVEERPAIRRVLEFRETKESK